MRPSHLLLSCALALAAGAAGAQVKSFLLIPGVPGESTDDAHRNWIDLNTVSVGVADRACTGVTLTKSLDTSSPLLSGAALTGSSYPTITVDVARTTPDRPEVFLTYTLTNVTVTSVQTTTTPYAPVMEAVQLMPTTIKIAYRPSGTAGAGVSYMLTCLKK